MRGAIALAIVLGAVALLLVFHGEETIGGFRPDQIASLAWVSAVGILVLGWVVRHFRGRWTQALEALAFWLALIVALVALYSYRFDLARLANRLLGEVAPGYVVVADGGEVSVARHAGGSFILSAEVNGRPAQFVFDTGASTVVLTSETAGVAGFDARTLDYSHPMTTANGRTVAAAVVLDRLAVGPIIERRVPALVARPGALSENLLGMSFLERLASYEVRNGHLILR
ncbi:TIGR02281 family clan AA aspartic protease [Chelatococcus sp. SYSU_G07232]|uniref:TIGR02281 family clan AA aspartic protease n=1 Tax=Chelatococcus albus TaxID=3047466 RepID=A0ABT7AK92_9HYPH|nr:TIGR02281 family clan AA aspartic protease [Chelatococcus sp. SYSU_G07232]MDJ1159792.1 TIGR02281 family clan AA aspartic protease [Chelatococcus sp. SYSU_G07232]